MIREFLKEPSQEKTKLKIFSKRSWELKLEQYDDVIHVFHLSLLAPLDEGEKQTAPFILTHHIQYTSYYNSFKLHRMEQCSPADRWTVCSLCRPHDMFPPSQGLISRTKDFGDAYRSIHSKLASLRDRLVAADGRQPDILAKKSQSDQFRVSIIPDQTRPGPRCSL